MNMFKTFEWGISYDENIEYKINCLGDIFDMPMPVDM